MYVQDNRVLKTLKIKIDVFKRVESKRKKEKKFKSFNELQVHMNESYIK